MPNDSFTEISSQSWFSRIGDSIKGILFGLILFIGAFPFIFWNEGRAIDTEKGLEEGAAAVLSVGTASIDAANEGKLVHFNGNAETDEVLTDADFGVEANAIKLTRTVEMYQWREDSKSETVKKLGGGTETKTTYTYIQVWSGSAFNSSDFKHPEGHENPATMPYVSTDYVAKDVTVGAYELPGRLISGLSGYHTITPTLDKKNLPTYSLHGDQIFSNDPASPRVGDLRIGFSVVDPGPVSVIGKQLKQTVEPYYTKTGTSIELIASGTLSAENMFKAELASNNLITWLLRLGCFFMMYAGLALILRPLSVLGDVVPFIGSLVGMGTGLVAGLLAFSLTVITIAIAWFAVRPILSVILIAARAAGFFGIRKFSSKKTEDQQPAGAVANE